MNAALLIDLYIHQTCTSPCAEHFWWGKLQVYHALLCIDHVYVLYSVIMWDGNDVTAYLTNGSIWQK